MLERQVIAKQTGIVCRTILLLSYLLFRRLIGQLCIGPNLTMRMGVAGTHHGPAIFENRGAMMGASNPHPHCQIWANAHLPNEPAKEQIAQQEYRSAHNSCLLCDYLALEHELGQRIVCENQYFSALVPFWSVWPFETLLLPSEHRASIDEFTEKERGGLAD